MLSDWAAHKGLWDHLDLDCVVIGNVAHAAQHSNTLIEVRHLLQACIRELVGDGLQALL